MKRNVVACLCSIAAVTIIAACDGAGPTELKNSNLPRTLPTSPGEDISVTTESDVGMVEVQTSPCTGQDISINSNSHWVMVVNFPVIGGTHLIYNVITKGVGVGPNYEQYKISEQVHDVEQSPPNSEGLLYNSIRSIKVDGPGTAQDYTIVVSFLVKVSPNGVSSPTIERSYLKCGAP